MGKHPHVQFVLLNRVPWDVILDGSHLASAAEEEEAERRRGGERITGRGDPAWL